jgi:hypothetical protein
MAKVRIRHSKLGREAEVEEATVERWRKRGWSLVRGGGKSQSQSESTEESKGA